MQTISQETINEINQLISSLKNERYELTAELNLLKVEHNFLTDEYRKSLEENERKFNDLLKYEKEIEYLKQRNKDLRQKTWIQVYEENLKLAQEIEQYKYMLKSIENFIGVMESEKR